MTQLATGKRTRHVSVTWEVKTPDGTMFVHVLEDEGRPVGLMVNLGKAGSAISAWAQATSALATLALEKGAGINELIQELSGLSSDRPPSKYANGVTIRSALDGIAYALMQYKNHSYQEHVAKLEGKSPKLVIDNGPSLTED
jgi:hypothetical protein